MVIGEVGLVGLIALSAVVEAINVVIGSAIFHTLLRYTT